MKRNKHDPADAEALRGGERPSMRFVPIKTEEQQAVLIMHRTRELLVRQRTQVVNALRGHWRSSGSSSRRASGTWAVCALASRTRVRFRSPDARSWLASRAIDQLEQRIAQVAARSWPGMAAIRSVGGWPGSRHRPVIASAIVATVPDPRCSARAGSLPPGWASFPGSTRPAQGAYRPD